MTSFSSADHFKPFLCLRCGCKGQVVEEPLTIKSTECDCICCRRDPKFTSSNCIFSNIDNCRYCKKPYVLNRVDGCGFAYLCKERCDPDVSSRQDYFEQFQPSNYTMLTRAVSRGNVDITWKLLKKGVNPFHTDLRGNSAVQIVRSLLSCRSYNSSDIQEKLFDLYSILPKVHYPLMEIQRKSPSPPQMLRSRSDDVPRRLVKRCITEEAEIYSRPTTVSLDTGHIQVQKLCHVVTKSMEKQLKLQVFSPQALQRRIDENNAEISEETIDSSLNLNKSHKWTTIELYNSIVNESFSMDYSTRNCNDQALINRNGVECSVCYDNCPSHYMFFCPHLDCEGRLCKCCLFKSVFVTITSALYAVPKVRCVSCLRRIPTSVWRSELRTLPENLISVKDKLALKSNDGNEESAVSVDVRILRFNEKLYEYFEEFVDIVCGGIDDDSAEDREDFDENEERDNASPQGTNHTSEAPSVATPTSNPASADPSTDRWRTKASREAVTSILHSCFWCIQCYLKEIYSLHSFNFEPYTPAIDPVTQSNQDNSEQKFLYSDFGLIVGSTVQNSSKVFRASSTESEVVGLLEWDSGCCIFEMSEVYSSGTLDQKWLKLSPSHYNTLKNCAEFKEHNPNAEGFVLNEEVFSQLHSSPKVDKNIQEAIHNVYSSAFALDICGSHLPVSITSFSLFSDLVCPGKVLKKSEVDTHIEEMESKLDTMLDIGEGIRGPSSSTDEARTTWELVRNTMCYFLADLAVMLRAIHFSDIVSDFEDSNGQITPSYVIDTQGNENGFFESDSDGETCFDNDSEEEEEEEESEDRTCQDIENSNLKAKKGNIYDFSLAEDKEQYYATRMNACAGAEELLIARYCFNARALLMLRCAECDETRSLFDTNGKHFNIYAPDNRGKLLTQIMKGLDDAEAHSFLKAFVSFNNGGPPKEFIELLMTTYLKRLRAIKSPRETAKLEERLNRFRICSGESLKYAKAAFSLILDIERRLSAHLELLRQYPKIFTECCKCEHCFMCKVEGHHIDRTCEEVQRHEINGQCQYCPSCNVPTLRSEGCSEILCVCGAVWDWAGEDGSSASAGSESNESITSALEDLTGEDGSDLSADESLDASFDDASSFCSDDSMEHFEF